MPIMKVKEAYFYHKRRLMRNKESTLPGLMLSIIISVTVKLITLTKVHFAESSFNALLCAFSL